MTAEQKRKAREYALRYTLRRVYTCRSCKDDSLLYIGSASLTLKDVENNHRNAFKKWPGQKQTDFRTALQKNAKDCYFVTVIERVCQQPEIEDYEGQLIRTFRPKYNVDMDPVLKSIKKGRYTRKDYENTLR